MEWEDEEEENTPHPEPTRLKSPIPLQKPFSQVGWDKIEPPAPRWSPTPYPTGLFGFQFKAASAAPKPTPSQARPSRSASPSKRQRANTSPLPPNPDEIELTRPTRTPVMTTMAAHILELSELVKQLQADLTTTKAMVTSLLARPAQASQQAPLAPPPKGETESSRPCPTTTKQILRRRRSRSPPTQQRLATGESQGL